MLRFTVAGLMAALGAMVGCGTNDSGLGQTDPGTGSGTLLVNGDVQYDTATDSAAFTVQVKRAGATLDGARVHVTSALGAFDLTGVGGGSYRGAQRGWARAGYALEVTARDAGGNVTDDLSGTLAAALAVQITSPDMSKPIDARALSGGALSLTLAGPAADRADVRTKDFHPATFQPDPLQVSIPATVLQDRTQELDITRQSSVALAGGLAGSRLTVEYHDHVGMIISTPFKN